MAARVGANGMVVGTERKQGTYTTPAGRYRITESFGIAKNPGAKLRYTKVDRRHWWVEEKTSRYYNQMRRSTQGGFRRNHSLSEHLIDYGKQYKYAAVIDFNRPKPVRGRGAGIFLHVNGPRATAGCVSVSERNMKAIMRWLDPKKKPVIVMGPRSWLATQ
jgi:L,D-peptidoglycan transpeptidase YkuD (ErfK/YbiS/YcfS/YnhG family)